MIDTKITIKIKCPFPGPLNFGVGVFYLPFESPFSTKPCFFRQTFQKSPRWVEQWCWVDAIDAGLLCHWWVGSCCKKTIFPGPNRPSVQLPTVGYWPTVAMTGNGELGFDSGEHFRSRVNFSVISLIFQSLDARPLQVICWWTPIHLMNPQDPGKCGGSCLNGTSSADAATASTCWTTWICKERTAIWKPPVCGRQRWMEQGHSTFVRRLNFLIIWCTRCQWSSWPTSCAAFTILDALRSVLWCSLRFFHWALESMGWLYIDLQLHFCWRQIHLLMFMLNSCKAPLDSFSRRLPTTLDLFDLYFLYMINHHYTAIRGKKWNIMELVPINLNLI